ncbi:MAG: hypothetical protein AB2L14_11895 [Candidatus Xenobiia bacterium LiM19]
MRGSIKFEGIFIENAIVRISLNYVSNWCKISDNAPGIFIIKDIPFNEIPDTRESLLFSIEMDSGNRYQKQVNNWNNVNGIINVNIDISNSDVPIDVVTVRGSIFLGPNLVNNATVRLCIHHKYNWSQVCEDAPGHFIIEDIPKSKLPESGKPLHFMIRMNDGREYQEHIYNWRERSRIIGVEIKLPQESESLVDHKPQALPPEIELSQTKKSFYFHSVGVKKDLIATIFVIWIEFYNRSDISLSVMEALLSCNGKMVANCSKPHKEIPYSNVTYIRNDLQNNAGRYYEFDIGNANFEFNPHFFDVNLYLEGKTSHVGSLIFWMMPAGTTLSGPLDCKIVIRSSHGTAELPLIIEQLGV